MSTPPRYFSSKLDTNPEGREAFERGLKQYNDIEPKINRFAFESFQEAIEKSHQGTPCKANANYYLGMCYLKRGYGVAPNASSAFKCFEKAADAGHPYAKYELAICNRKAIGTKEERKDIYEAYKLLNQIIHDTETPLSLLAKAQYELSLLYVDDYSPPDHSKAHEFRDRAADTFCKLGHLAIKSQDIKEPFNFFRQAAELGSAEGLYQCGKIHENDAKRKQFVDSAGDAAKSYKQAADKGHAQACFETAKCYENGFGVEQNDSIAYSYYQEAEKFETDPSAKDVARRAQVSLFQKQVKEKNELKRENELLKQTMLEKSVLIEPRGAGGPMLSHFDARDRKRARTETDLPDHEQSSGPRGPLS